MSRPGHPTSLAVAQCIETLRNALFTEYGTDYEFHVSGKGYLLASSYPQAPTHDGVVEAVTRGPSLGVEARKALLGGK